MEKAEKVIRPRPPEGLPPPETTRWTPRRKAALLLALSSGLLTADQLQRCYSISAAELEEWKRGFDRRGRKGLKATELERPDPRQLCLF